MSKLPPSLPGLTLLPGRLARAEQEALVAELREVVAAAPLFTPVMPRTGKPFSVCMTNCGPLGWVSDRAGYRYQATHPATGRPWPAIPARLLALWDEVTGYAAPPEACLVNFYGEGAKMGLHQDRDEEDFAAPLLSVSLGDTGRFRLGGVERSDPTRAFPLASGDVLMLSGASRLAHHGIDRILPGTSTLLSGGGRINLTLRRVTTPVSQHEAAQNRDAGEQQRQPGRQRHHPGGLHQ
ncbi:MAG: alpha-ketoglutarate-dependent dioxygenase AlkB [Phyllobacteriaceae bacterium]|nr:alpha-ketoglutarate-dependent dioxygenase AlkB [Phyllobacteriaceae bacterium]